MNNNEQYIIGLKKAMKLCSKSEKCKSDIRKKLYQWGIDTSQHNIIIDQLIDDNFINELRYTKAFVKDKLNAKWGKEKINFSLKQKLINNEQISTEILNIDNNTYIENLKYLFKKKKRITTGDDNYKIKEKIIRHLLSKGYNYDIITKELNFD